MTSFKQIPAFCCIGALFVLFPNVFAQTNPGSDIIFVVDSSDRVSSAQFDQMKSWMTNLVEYWNVAPADYRIGFVTYGNGAHMGTTLLQGSQNFAQVTNNINSLSYSGGTSDAAAAMKMAATTGFSAANGGRSNRPQIIIHVGAGSDGTNSQLLTTETEAATGGGKRVYTVGVGSGWTKTLLQQSSSSPDSRYALTARNFGELNTVEDPLIERVENEVPPSANSLPPASSGCLRKADIVLVVDGSYSVTSANFQTIKENLKNLTVKLPIAKDGIHLGVEQYSGKTSLEFPLDMYTDRLSALGAIDKIPYLGGGTRTGKAIQYMREQMFSATMGARSGVPRIGIVITDGKSPNIQNTKTQADAARGAGIEMLAVGIGSSVDKTELDAIAGNPNHVYQVSGFDGLNTLVDPILTGTCDATGTMAPPTAASGASNLTETCVDTIKNCDGYVRAYASAGGYCNTYKTQAQQQCPFTCGFCTTIIPQTAPPCIDEWTNCTDYLLSSCTDPVYMPFMRSHCKQKCGLCDVEGQTTGFQGKCLYKNKLYGQGAKWYDGCDYECVCTDAVHGKYECTNKCDVYYDLPSECTLVKREGECCLQPVCNFKSSVQTSVINQPVDHNGRTYCSYNNKRYSQNEYFEDGCNKKCTCVDANAGHIECRDYCPTYDLSALPHNCFLEEIPGACCSQPRCEFQTTVGTFTGHGTTSGTGISKTFWDADAQPPCVDVDTKCNLYDKSSCTDPSFAAYMLGNCPKYCDLCDKKNVAPTVGPLDKCYYDGKLYDDGDTWEPDCAHQCVCDTQMYGYYRCTNKCTDYQDIPNGCTVQKLAGQCCPQIVCQGNQVIVPSTTNVLSQGSGDSVYKDTATGGSKPLLPQVRPDGTIDPNNSGVQLPSITGCLYSGRLLVQGETGMDDQCGDVCECIDATKGSMSCTQRCPIYQNVDPRCSMVQDPRDSCCKTPSCPANVPLPVAMYNTPKPVIGVVAMPDPQTLVPLKDGATPQYPATTQAAVTPDAATNFPLGHEPKSYNPPPTMPPGTVANPNDGTCLFNMTGKIYKEGERWTYGCDYNCLCIDGSRGLYVCNDVCKHFVCPASYHCTEYEDPDYACCKLLKIEVATLPPPSTTLAPTTTEKVKIENCVDGQGNQHPQGSVWLPTCDLKCVCVDAGLNSISCNNRCPQYYNLPTETCQYVEDPSDPCCKIPICHAPDDTTQNPLQPVQLPSGGFEVTAAPGTNFCVYNSKNYKQDEVWYMDCDFKCTCIDQLMGKQNCQPRCPRFDESQLPPICHMVTDPADTCCQKPQCSFDFTAGTIGGTLEKPKVPPIYQNINPHNFDPSSVPRCSVNGVFYYEGNEWFENGCAKKCRCEDAVNNVKSCEDRCPTITPQQNCVIVTDPDNVCCKKKECHVSPSLLTLPGDIDPVLIPTLAPGVIVGGPDRAPPTAGPDGVVPSPPPINKCVYKGSTYRQGDTWFDGCDKKCECNNARDGKYKCTDRCPRYPEVLPKQCKLFSIPGEPCCKELDCSLDPNPVTLAAPTVSDQTTVKPTLAPNVPTIASGVPLIPVTVAPDVCQDGTGLYTAGQAWYVGCDLKCFCAAGGIKQCQSRCKNYPAPGAGMTCVLKPDPADSTCCTIPECTSTGPTPTPQTGPHLLPSVAPPGSFTGIGATRVPPTIDPSNPSAPKPTPTPKCLYKGVHYDEGDSWADGCDLVCTCQDASTGKYKCTDTCPSYPATPPGCYKTRDVTNPCCEIPFCPDDPALLAPPTGASGQTLRPTYNPHPTPSKCEYNGVLYAEGESWDDGCDYHCTCDDAKTGDIRCDRMCPEYKNIDPGCILVTDDAKPCCRRPLCPPKMPVTVAPPTGPDGHTLRPPVVIPIPTAEPGVYTGQRVDTPDADPNAPKKCEFRGQKYNTGDTWTDGDCGKKCTCADEVKGKYECVDRCPPFKASDMPDYCKLETDPSDTCCLKPVCSDPLQLIGVATPPTRAPGVTPDPLVPTYQVKTHTPVCTYNNHIYLKGQVWNEGCSKTCECIEVGSELSPFCNDRCPDYGPVPTGCSLVPDPDDVDCCKVVSCVPPVGPDGKLTSPAPGVQPTPFVVTGVPGVVYGRLPTNSPGDTGLARKRCVYDGREYTTGQTWRDGCEKQCQCVDQNEGLYKCTELCTKYTSVPLQCSLHQDPNNACCRIMICDPNKVVEIAYVTDAPVTLAPTSAPTTQDPNGPVVVRPVPTVSSGGVIYTLPPTQRPSLEFCVYNGATYRQGDTFKRNCQLMCRCDDARNNIVNCFERCPVYNDLGPDCTLEVDPNDPCCRIKHCSDVPNVVKLVTAVPPTSHPGDPSKPAQVKVPQPVVVPGGTLTGEDPAPKPGLEDVCVYNGRQYKRSVTWKDGCGVTCTCTDPVNNKYSCTDKCNKFEKVPANCAITKDADNCCDVATCYDPASLPTFQPPVTIISGVTISPDVQPSKSSTPVCRYNGQMLTEGQVYQDDNCRETCVCEDAANNYVSCVPRCMTYKANPSCELLPDPADPQCCQIPKCSAQDPLNPQGVTGGYTVVATPPSLAPPPPKPTSVPNEPTPVVVTLPRAGCYFKRRVYNQGEKWQDDCKNCECTDEVNNVYKCTSMCPSYPDLPPYCTYVYDSMNPCCKKPQCNVPAPPTQYPGQTTLIPPTPDYCMDKGVSHMEGDSWDEGCSSVLTCEDAASNAISKRDKCAKTQPPQPGCRLETDPRSPCCQILTCEEPNTNDPLKVVQGVPGKVTGSSKPPQSSNPLVPRTLGCFMKRRVYRQGESWDDGCSYRCTCEDEVTGDYSCDERCPPLPDLPSTCSLVVDPRDSCCQVASCTPPSDLVPDLVTVTPNPLNPGAPTVQMLAPPIKGVCLYKGQYLRRGQVYYDGDCDKVCTCEDVDNNLVRCRDVCAKIAPSAGCTLIPDPDNPTCCQVEECPLPPTLTPPSKPDYQRPPMNKPQVIYGSPAPMTIVGDGPRPVTTYTSCLYNGKSYKQGETWDDGCDFYCECVNATTATHRCNKRCPTVLPRAECVLAEDPNDPCCQTLFCDFVNPDPFPSGIPSTVKVIQPNKPQISSPYIIPGDPSSVVIVQPNAKTNPQLGFCLYNGAQYLQSQRWNVKCDQTCTCVNATSGVYSCVDRCPAYEPAAGCQLRTSPTDACCLVQDCGPNYLDPVFQVTPDPSKAPVTYKPDFVQPGEVAIRPGNPPTYIKTINSPVVPGASSDQIRIQRTKCIAEDGHFYSQGESWNTASERCVCIDAAANKAQCTQRCGDYYFLPNGCRMDVDPNNAPCRIAICPVSSMQSTVPYTPGPTITTQSTTNIVTAVQPYNPTCVYKDGKAYHRNEAWTDGCQSCRCVDPNGNNYQCTRSCPAIKDLPEYCVMVMDFANPCCQKVSCTKNGVSLTPLLVDPVTHTSPALDPSKTNVIPIVTHPVITGHGDPANVSPSVLRQYGGSNACVYKGRLYRPGESWEDGCEQSCTCENNARGMYTCIQICGLEPPVPSYCRKVRIPGQCCDTITCEIPKVGQYVPSSTISQLLPGVIPQLVPGDTTLTVLPNEAPTTTLTVPGGGYTVTDTQIQKITNRCVKDNKAYKQGETWQEGCDITCECIEEATGFYQCTHKCPIYDNAKAGCVLTIIPGQCCKRLICNDPDTGLTFDPILHPRDDYIVYGRYPEGFSGFRPYYVPSGVSTSFMGCYFNGKVYAEGQSWQDKCNYECTCLDGHKHTMQCKSMCYSYSHIPSACTLSASNNHCCQEVLCPTSLGGITPTPVMRPGLNISEGNCVDTISNCEDYTVEACGPNYAVWAKKYCPRFCGLCPNAPLQVLTCVDREKNCNAYGQAACSSPDTKMWMHRNCYRTCGYCNSCQDVDDACGQLNHLTCTGVWAPWARQMCAKTCNYCSSGSSSSTTGTTGSAAVPSGWMLLMKGVSGVPGDLYSLWSQTGGLNEDQALAKVLTNQYLGHYKSSLADSFGSCDFSKIRVGVYNNGVERGYVIFNAHGATKQNVFDPSRILSSTWNDVRSSSSHFSLPKSSTTGREFSLGKSQSSCSGQGWLFVSTSSSCSYESGANSFYFSPSTGAVEYKDMVQGDVIAVMAQGGSCTSQSVTSAQGCRYLNKYYKIGETWTEGCENDCQCIALNSTHTAVQCHNKCPQYKDVPKNCQMVKSPGSCCSTPVCSGCVDPKNPAKVYREGERWRDGCESDCTCLASSTISCQAVCLTMTLTPAQNATCTYPTPAPGKCCALPSCPGLIFQIPDANKKDY